MDEATLHCLCGLWGHSREEDRNGLVVYRRKGFKFPLARGRRWIEFSLDGQFTDFAAGPDDRTRAAKGSWSAIADDVLELRDGHDPSPRRLTIVECGSEVLKVRAD